VTVRTIDTVSDRWIRLEGADNVRHLGGLATGDGGATRPGLLIRSDTVQRLTTEDARKLTEDLGLRTLIDLRTPKEAAREGRGPLADTSVAYVNVPFLPDRYLIPGDPEHKLIIERRARQEQSEHYFEYLARPGSPVADAVRLLIQPGTLPALFHCAAGKDRTGVLAALVLDLVGVPRETIVADYLLTNNRIEMIKRRLIALGTYRESADRDISVQASTMVSFFERLDGQWGGTVEWARAAGLTDDELAALRRTLVA
jgi:protein tyrosine/serine phosphatase